MLKLLENFLIDNENIIGYNIDNYFVFKKDIEIYLCSDSNKHFIYLKNPRKYTGFICQFRGMEEGFYTNAETVFILFDKQIKEINNENIMNWMKNDKAEAFRIAELNYKEYLKTKENCVTELVKGGLI